MKEGDGGEDDAVDDDSLRALWAADSNSSRTHACVGRRNPLESKEEEGEGALFPLCSPASP